MVLVTAWYLVVLAPIIVHSLVLVMTQCQVPMCFLWLRHAGIAKPFCQDMVELYCNHLQACPWVGRSQHLYLLTPA